MGGGISYPITRLSQDRVILVTGANRGLGYEIAKWCAMMGATVIMGCRSEQRTKQAIDQMNKEFKTEKEKGTEGITDSDTLALEFVEVDLASFKSVKKFTEELKASGRKLHVLFLNAGVGFAPSCKTEDGFESILQVNYLGQFLMAAKLLPIMQQSGDDCRILLVSSFVHTYGDFDMDTIYYTGPPSDYPNDLPYCRSKLYQIMQVFSMVERLGSSNITVNSINPGFVLTGFASKSRGLTKFIIKVGMMLFGKTPEVAAKSSIDYATNPKHAGITGQYIDGDTVKIPSKIARNAELQEKLWKETFRLIQDHVTEEDISLMEGNKR